MNILRRFTDFILQNRIQAMGVAFLLSYVPLIGSISTLIVGLVTLRKGALEGILILIAATFPYVLSYYASSHTGHEEDMLLMAMGFIVISNILVWFFAVLLRYFNSWSPLLEYSLLLSILVIGIVHMVFPDIQSWWGVKLTEYFSQSSKMVSELPSDKYHQETLLQMAGVLKPYATGLCVVLILLNSFLQLVLARWWQAIIFNPGGLREELRMIRMSHVMGLVFIICFVLATLKYETMMDIMPVFFSIFTVAALSLIHYLFAILKTGWIWLMLFYIVFILLSRFSFIFLSLIALLDVGFDFRKRLVKP